MIKLLFIFFVGLISFCFLGKKTNVEGFFKGKMENNSEPSTLAITFSLVTTWIFSRSLLTAAILAYYFGLPGAIAYTIYYLSFITGCIFVINLRKRYRINSVVEFFSYQFGNVGIFTYSFLIITRLISEIFANLIVVGLVFGKEGAYDYNISIFIVMVVTLSYSYLGGFRNSIKTDVIQMIVFIILIVFMIVSFFFIPLELNKELFVAKIYDISNPAYALILVAFLQIWSYPIHDPVMMDRGFISSIKKTKKSFFYSFFLSSILILLFSLIGIFLSGYSLDNVSFIEAISIYFGRTSSYIIFFLLIISAMSTIDSTLSSCSKLIVSDLGLLKSNIFNGRLVMLIFSMLGLAFIFLNTKDLFTAVAVSGTAAIFLSPTYIMLIIFKKNVSKLSLLVSFFISVSGSILYYLESQAIYTNFSSYLSLDHKYKTLLVINILVVLICFFSAFMLKKK